MEYKELIDALSDDQEYYNGIGKQYLSSSDIGTLLRNPRLFGVPRKDDKSLSEGRLFHTMILEPEKEINIPICDSGSRNTKAYKEFIADKGVEFCLLKKEYDKVVSWVDTIKSNFDFYRMIYAEGNRLRYQKLQTSRIPCGKARQISLEKQCYTISRQQQISTSLSTQLVPITMILNALYIRSCSTNH